MSQLLFLGGKSIGNIGRRPLSVVTSLISLILLFLMLSLIWISFLTGNQYFMSTVSAIDMEVFFDDNLEESTVETIIESISMMNGVGYMVYISKDDAREKLFSLMGTDLLEGLETNPLPRSIVLEFEDSYVKSAYLNKLAEDIKNLDGITELYYPSQWLENIEYSRSLAMKIVVFLAIVISIAIILNLLHSIRLSARARQEELFQLRLLGASRGFLSIPYVLESLFYSFVASVSSWLIIFYAGSRLTFKNIIIIFPTQLDIIYFCGAALLIGLVAGYLAIRRSL